MPKILTRLVALVLAVVISGNSPAWPQADASSTLFRSPINLIADRLRSEALAPSARDFEHPGAACGSVDPPMGRLVASVMPSKTQGIQHEDPQWLEANATELKGKNILEVTAEMALTPAIFDLLERQMASERTEIDETTYRRLAMERLREAAMAGSVGGIGPLLRERLISQAALGANVIGVSLLYSHVWIQEKMPVKTTNGWTRYKLEKKKVEVGSLLRKVLKPAGEIRLQMYDGTETYVKAWMAPPGTYGKATMYFLDPVGLSDVVDGRANVVYPGSEDADQDKEEARLVQQWVLGRGALALSKFTGPEYKPDVIVMSETAAMMAHPTVFRDGFSEDPFFKDAVTVFNDHTPLEYAHPHWDPATLERVHVDPRLMQDRDLWIKKKIDDRRSESFLDMTAMIVNASRGVFGVAKKHAEVMRAMPGLKRFTEKIRYVTNGVSRHFWPTQDLQENYQSFLRKSDEELCLWKDRERLEGLQWLAEREGLDDGWAERVKDMKVLVWNRRQVEYKRLERLPQMLRDEGMRKRFLQSNTMIVFGGRIHPDDPYGVQQYEQIQDLLEQYPKLRDRLVFFENYNVLEAPRLFRMADGSMMLSDDGREAAATGFQKAQLNGAAIIAVDDGAVPESVKYYGRSENPNGFEVPYERAYDRENKEYRTPTAEGLCEALAQFGKVYSNRQERGRMIRNALESAPKIGVERTAQDQLKLLQELVQDQQREQQAEREGLIMARKAVRDANLTPDKARVILDYLNRQGLGPFVWKYQHNKELFHGGAGLHQIVKDFDHLKALGTLGIWALAFHANRDGGASDLGAHIDDVFTGMQGHFPGLHRQLIALDQSMREGDVPKRVHQQQVLMAFLRQIENELGRLAVSGEPEMSRSGMDSGSAKKRIAEAVENGAGTVLELNASPSQLFSGEPVRVEAEVNMKELTSWDMRADLLMGRRSRPSQWSEMDWTYLGQGRYRVAGEQILSEHGTYRSTTRISPRDEMLWPNGRSLDQATRSTQFEQRIYVDDRSGAQQATVHEGGRILQIHAMAYGAYRTKSGKVVPGTAAYLFGQLPKILRQPFSDVYLYCLLPTGRLVNDLAKNNRRDLKGTDFFALNENPRTRSRRWFVYQPATDGHKDLIGSPYAYSNPKGVNSDWGKMADFDAVRDILKASGKGLYMDYSANQTGLDDPWLLQGENWKAAVHIDLPGIIPVSTLSTLDDKDFYNVQTLREKLGGAMVDLLHQEFAKKNLGLGEGLQYCVFYKTPGDPSSRIIMAHARDPIQTPWIDTIQLDLAKPEARARVFDVARFWAAKGIHLRIDMADLSIRDAYLKQWYPQEFKELSDKQDREDRTNRLWGYSGDFWDEFYAKVMVSQPDFRIILEAYRDLEYLNRFARVHNTAGQRPRIAVYEKSLYDNFDKRDPQAIRDTLSGLPDRHSLTFAQNHDDSAPLDWKKALSYAKLLLALLAFAGGELLIHYRQLRGEPKMPVKQILPDTPPLWPNEVAEAIEQFHVDMLDLHASPVVQQQFKLVVHNGNQNLIAMTRELNGQRLLIVANPKPADPGNSNPVPEKDYIPLPSSWLPQHGDRLVFEEKYYRENEPSMALGMNRAAPVYVRSLEDLTQNGGPSLYVELMPQQVHVFVVYKEPNGNISTAPNSQHADAVDDAELAANGVLAAVGADAVRGSTRFPDPPAEIAQALEQAQQIFREEGLSPAGYEKAMESLMPFGIPGFVNAPVIRHDDSGQSVIFVGPVYSGRAGLATALVEHPEVSRETGLWTMQAWGSVLFVQTDNGLFAIQDPRRENDVPYHVMTISTSKTGLHEVAIKSKVAGDPVRIDAVVHIIVDRNLTKPEEPTFSPAEAISTEHFKVPTKLVSTFDGIRLPTITIRRQPGNLDEEREFLPLVRQVAVLLKNARENTGDTGKPAQAGASGETVQLSMWLVYGPVWLATWVWLAVRGFRLPDIDAVTQRARRWTPPVEEVLFRGALFGWLLGLHGGHRLFDVSFWHSSSEHVLGLLAAHLAVAMLLQAVVFAALHVGKGWGKGFVTRFSAAIYLQYLFFTCRPFKAIRVHALNNKIFWGDSLSDADYATLDKLPSWLQERMGVALWQQADTALAEARHPPRKDGIFAPIYALRDREGEDQGKGDIRSLAKFILFVALMGMNRVQVPPITMSDYAPAPYSNMSTLLKETGYVNLDWAFRDVAATLPPATAARLRSEFDHFMQTNATKIEAARNYTETRTYPDDTRHTYPLSNEGIVSELKQAFFNMLWKNVGNQDEGSPLKKSMAEFERRPENNDPELRSLRHHLLYLVLKLKHMQTNWRSGWASASWGELADSTNEVAIALAMEDEKGEIEKQLFVQWLFDQQFGRILDFAELLDVTLADDEPYGIPKADAWLRPDIIAHDFEGAVPADQFSPLPQPWEVAVLTWKKCYAACERYITSRFLNGLGREPDKPTADREGYEQAKAFEREKLKERLMQTVSRTSPVSIEDVVYEASETMARLRRQHHIEGRQGVMMRRKDHGYGLTRVYALSTKKVTAQDLLIQDALQEKVQEGLLHPEKREQLAKEATDALFQEIRRSSEFAPYVDSLFDEKGGLRMSVSIQMARPAEGDKEPAGFWYRRRITHKVVHTDGPEVWDICSISDLDPLWMGKVSPPEKPLQRMVAYMWPNDPSKSPRAGDEIVVGLYDYNGGKFNDTEAVLQRLYEKVIRRGAEMVIELLGNPYVPAIEAAGRVQTIVDGVIHCLFMISPGIYGQNPGEEYYYDTHGPGTQATLALQDSPTMMQDLADQALQGQLQPKTQRLLAVHAPSGLFPEGDIRETLSQMLLQFLFLSDAGETMPPLFDLRMAMDDAGRPNNPNIKVPHPNWSIREALGYTVDEMLLAAVAIMKGLNGIASPWAEQLVKLIDFLQTESGRPAAMERHRMDEERQAA